MFPKHAFEEDWLKRQAKTMGGCAPQILERCVHALTLLGHLQESGLPFVFRGGTCILLHLPEIHRLSIDIDIICAVTGKELESVLEAVGKRAPFTRHEESVRDGDRLPRRRHFKFFYPSALKPKVQNTFPEHALLRDGYLGMRGHLTRKFTEQDFRTVAARAALLASHLRAGAIIDFESVRYAGTKEQIDELRAASFNNTPWGWADGLRQVNPEAYHYWLAASRLLGIGR